MPTEPTQPTGPTGPAAAGGADEPGADPVLALWAELEAVVSKLAVATLWSRTDAQARAGVAAGHRVLAMVESAWLSEVRDLDVRGDAVAGARAGQVARTFLVHALHRSGRQAAADVRAARALDPDRSPAEGGMPRVGEAFAAGAISRRHVDTAERVLNDLPAPAAKAVDQEGLTGAERVEQFLADQAVQVDPETLTSLGRQVLARLDPDRDEAGYDADAHRRRFLSLVLASDGMTVGRFALPAAHAAVLRAALDSFGAPQPATEQPDQDGQLVLVTDERTRGQRLADALLALARTALAAHAAGAAEGGEPAQVTVITDLDQLAAARATTEPRTGGTPAQAAGLAHCVGHGPISAAALAMLACDARLRTVVLDRHGAVLHLGRSQRLASKAQRLALAARDRGCVIPGCTVPATICDAHHVTYWSHGGPTDIDAMALLCPRHHADVHHGHWQLRMVNGIPWARPPAWATAARDRSWLRNTIHHTLDTARRLGHQLRLDLDP